MSNSKMQAAFCLLVCMVVHASFATVTYTNWYPNPAKNTGARADGTAALKDRSYWMANGTVGSGEVGSCDRLIIDRERDGDNSKRLRFGSIIEFKGYKLQIGSENVGITVVQDSSTIKFSEESEGLHLKSGNWWFNSSGVLGIDGPITVLAEDPEKPFVFHVGQDQYSNAIDKIKGTLKGSENARIVFGPWGNNVGEGKRIVSAQNTTFELHNISGYAGTITIDSDYENVGTDFGTRVKFDSAESSAKIHVRGGGSISTLAFDDKVTVGSLTFEEGTRIYIDEKSDVINGSLGHFHATESLSVNGKVEICYKPIIRGTQLYRIPILSGPAATSTFSVDDFDVTFIATKYNLDLHLEVASDPETGTRTLYVVTHGFVYQTDSYVGEKERDGKDGWPSSLTNSAAWWGDRIPHATNSAAIYRTAKPLRTLYAPREDYAFPCAIFYLNGGELIVQTKSFQVPELYISHGMIGIGQNSRNRDVRVAASKIHFMEAGSLVDFRAYNSNTLILEGEADGPGNINLLGWGGHKCI